uniref:Uncharacterized protein n=1 Tax=Anguilla anguilla TaxID=7936 RepID=A0A0E9PG71_ANGAN
MLVLCLKCSIDDNKKCYDCVCFGVYLHRHSLKTFQHAVIYTPVTARVYEAASSLGSSLSYPT